MRHFGMDTGDADGPVTGGLMSSDGIEFYRIDHVEQMEPFLMTVVSDSDLWMFVSSTGALTAGRVDADHAVFPYETDDRLHRSAGITGPVTVIARTIAGRRELWRPFGREPDPACVRSISKSVLGDRLVFEECHREWGIEFRATWAPSDAFGWVRTVELSDRSGRERELEVLDGFLDVMPAGVDALTEQIRSNLVDAYKRSECGTWRSLAVYSLESLITDRAEPAESLTATVVWSSGFPGAQLDLDGRAVSSMVAGRALRPQRLVTGRPGAYLLRGPLTVSASGSTSWTMVVDTGLGQTEVLAATRTASEPDGVGAVAADIRTGSARLRALLQGADAYQATADAIADAHHLSNVLFNSMRGGVFPYGHEVPVDDFVSFIRTRNRAVFERHQSFVGSLRTRIAVSDLRAAAEATGDDDLVRLVLEYLPLTFSRRHGDPSRPWNRFSINVRDDDGGQVLSYEGNWRDIFQNWEALLHAFPAYFAHVVAKFVNASTIDGYNPYRISRDGIDWEVPDPDDPWSHIGYWGDHQIVYLLRLLEAWNHHEPGAIAGWLTRPVFVYADVPYALADHDDMVLDPRNTITFDEQRAESIARREASVGSDGRLMVDGDGSLLRVGLLEKLLVPALAKLSNFVPHGGIWLNTQRPEWNDANNALAGPGLSMVTLYHLRRYLDFLASLVGEVGHDTATVSASVGEWFESLLRILENHTAAIQPVDDRERRVIVDALGRAGTAHRHRVRAAPAQATVEISISDVRRLCEVARGHLDGSIDSGRRADGLYHSYNRVSFPTGDSARVDHLGLMLEGQVAVLSSGALTSEESLAVLDALFASEMYRADQDTFVLYPATSLPSFLDRNVVPEEAVARLLGASGQLSGPLSRVFGIDADGHLRFRPGVANAAALSELLDRIGSPDLDRDAIQQVYEQVFGHDSFTGRSGSMYGYEGLGSVYWHMVAKLLLATQETYWAAVDDGEPEHIVDRLASAYRRIRAGLGFTKDPATFGAIPTDCYSHTPAHAGAQQPGMTGQVKEEILTRVGELGIRVANGRVSLAPGLLPPGEVFPIDDSDVIGPARLTVCSVPMTVDRGVADSVAVVRSDGTRDQAAGLVLTAQQSRELFARAGALSQIEWTVGDRTMDRWTRTAST